MRAISLLFHDVFTSDPAESGFRSPAADRYKLPRQAFETQLDAVAAARTDAPVTVANAAAVLASRHAASAAPTACPRRGSQLPPHSDGASAPPFLITFDDGGVSYYTLAADRLEARGWRGHCFVTTDVIGTPSFLTPAQLRELDTRGHVIGSHSASHPARFSACPFSTMVAEWSASRAVLEDILGHAVEVASVPGGYFSPAVARAAAEAGIRLLFTSEPVTTIGHQDGCAVMGRFTIRRHDAPDTAGRFVRSSSRARVQAWLSWNAKGLVKPLLGPAYIRLADRVHALRRSDQGQPAAGAWTPAP